MTRQRDLLLNFERMFREMDELLGDPFAELGWSRPPGRAQTGFSPRVDVFYCEQGSGEGGAAPLRRAIVLVELPGIDIDSVNLEIAGRELIVSGERATQETAGRLYQQMEIEAGPFRRMIELGADVDAERAQASYNDGILRVELPLRGGQVTTRVEIESEG